MIPRLARKVRKVLTDSEFSRQRIIEVSGISPDKVVAIPLAASEHFRMEGQDRIDAITRKYGLKPEKYLLSVSSLEPRKNLVRLLKAWSRILSDIPEDIHLVLAGATGATRVFSQLSLDTPPPRVVFTGYLPDESLPALYSGAMGFVYLSLYEGFGLPPLEAMGCGTPVISSTADSLVEVVGDAALLVAPEDEDAIADSLIRLIHDDQLRSRLHDAGLTRASQFSWGITADRVHQLLLDASQ
jgi:glycosyltransferase involved in cell wall biosynthesis